ncbi:MAG: HAD-IA family hydrolase [Lachnospiraceae bacterium]|nr:HAD-IA family hydrolase [Lachnospiraceae bacterium]
MKILFTSVGRRVELMQAFRHAADKTSTELIIYGAEISMTAPALAFCDKKIQVCCIRDAAYIPMLLEVCEKERIDALIPTIDTDLMLLSENQAEFEKIGTKVFISAPDKVALCRDKRYTSEFFVSCGLKAPTPIDDYTKYNMGFPAFIKPKDGSSSINAFKVENAEELKAKATTVDDYIVQPFVSGKEYTVDIFCDFAHNPIFITPRERVAVRTGEVLKTRICRDEKIKGECESLIKVFEPVGPITVQLIRDEKTGDDYYIEINPRFGGGAPLSIKAGADSAEAVIRLLKGEKISYSDVATDGATFSRFDQSVCVDHGANPEIKAVIFDLDDTLYSEKDYVESGYRAIEAQIGISFEALWDAFKDGKPAISEVLARMGRMDLKKKCLEIYRNHQPELSLYDGVEELIKNLKEKGMFVGIITDGRPEGQRAKLKALNLHVDKVVITDELGGAVFRKPCDIAFRIMKKASNVDFGQMVYIGDNPTKDFSAPEQLGIQSIWFDNPDGLYRKESYDGCKVHSITELSEKMRGGRLDYEA